ncbi:hypothetical protein RND81_09G247700 [Saponaria officinalis]|uniref:R3H domain-containing protein n=1 Tax=Saponaria officinalis TaxID=3572 RepID=A0AAW1IRZ7_SAPOF
MSVTQFAMVEELASLVKDNYPSRHLVLAVEEALINFLQSDPSPDGILELEPMSSYNRLILHRLADIFGFAHTSVGEGDDRHLVLQQCLETSIPSILVSDILWQRDQCESSPMPYQILRRDDACSVLKMNVSYSTNFVDREAAYQAARERIFGVNEVELKDAARQKPRTDPIVARRMISHALGQRINLYSKAQADNTGHHDEQSNVHDIETRFTADLDLASDSLNNNERSLRAKARPGKQIDKLSCKALNNTSSGGSVGPVVRDGRGIPKKSMKEENFGAAKRMFAHALGIQSSKDDVLRSREVKGATE